MSISDANATEQYGSQDTAEEDEQKKLDVDIQLRTRGEYRNGWGSLRSEGTKPAWFVNERARLNVGYHQKYLDVRVSAQHVGIWGDTGLDSKSGQFALNEAWARLHSKQGLFVQVGRQAIGYDDERIFGVDDWSTTGRSHDALRFGFENKLHKIHGIISFSQTDERMRGGTYYDGPAPYKHMQALWYHFGNENTPLQFSVLGVNHGVESSFLPTQPSTEYMQTVGAWIKYRYSGFFAKAEGYYQMGNEVPVESGVVGDPLKVSAYTYNFRLGYEQPLWGASLAGDYLSGNIGYKLKEETFNMLYGSSHKFYGAMDYFTNDAMLQCGLADLGLNAYVRPMPNLLINVDYHYFLTGIKIPKMHRPMGQEVDLHASWQLTKGVSLDAGYSMMMATSVMTLIKGGDNHCWQDWGWISLNVNPRVFSHIFRR